MVLLVAVWFGSAPARAQLVGDPVEGQRLFNQETFGGNGRTCATCHVATLNFRLTPANVAARFATLGTTFDPLFIAEPSMNVNTLNLAAAVTYPDGAILTGVSSTGATVKAKVLARVSSTSYLIVGGASPAFKPGTGVNDGHVATVVVSVAAGDLTGLESPAKMRGPSTSPAFPQGRALILENPDGFDQPGVFRKSPHLQNLIVTEPFGSENQLNLEDFTARAVMQHFPRSLARREGIDFRLPTAQELADLSAFQLSLLSAPELDLRTFARTAAQRSGQQAFQDVGCAGCHQDSVLGGRGEEAFSFATGVSNQPLNRNDGLPFEPPTDPVFGSIRQIATPALINIRNNAPYFHDASAATLDDVINHYTSDNFGNSRDAAGFGGKLVVSAAQRANLLSFLNSLSVRGYRVEDGGVDVTRANAVVDYGTVATTALPLPRTLTVRNTGTAAVVFQSPSCRINGLGFATVGDFTANCSALDGVSLAPGGTRSVTVTFDPPNAGNRNAILELLTADPTGVDLVAVATGPVGITDHFSTASTGTPPGWEMIRGGSFAVSGGQLRMTKCSGCIAPNGSILVSGMDLPDRFVYTLKGIATADSNDSNDFALIFNFQSVDNYYYASFNERLDKAGLFAVKNGVKVLLQAFPATTPPGDSSASLHSLRVEKTDARIRVLKGSTVYADVNDFDFSHGRAGVGSLNDSGRFDDFVITAVP